MGVDLAFRNNQNWVLVYNMSQWAAIYDLTKATFRMQIRAQATDALPVYSFSSVVQLGVRGTIMYDAPSQVLTIKAPYADARTYFKAGAYTHDLTIEVDDAVTGAQLIVRDAAAGTLTVTDGVTLR